MGGTAIALRVGVTRQGLPGVGERLGCRPFWVCGPGERGPVVVAEP